MFDNMPYSVMAPEMGGGQGSLNKSEVQRDGSLTEQAIIERNSSVKTIIVTKHNRSIAFTRNSTKQ